MWQRFTMNARMALFQAQEEAKQYGDGYVSTEHILLGMLRLDRCTAIEWLAALGVHPDAVRNELAAHLPASRGDTHRDLNLTPRAKRVVDLASDEALLLQSKCIGTEHLLVGLTLESDGFAGRVLAKLGVTPESLRRLAGSHSAAVSAPASTVGEAPTMHDMPTTGPSGTAEKLVALVLRDPTSKASFLLRKNLLDPVVVCQQLERVSAPDVVSLADILKAAEAARVETQANDIQPDHLVIAVIRLGNTVAAAALETFGVHEQALIDLLSS